MRHYRVAALLILTIASACHAEDVTGWTPARIVNIDYPLLALQSRTHGSVEIECILAGDGSVSNAKIRSGSTLLGRAVLERIGEWRFRAASNTASKSPALVTLTFTFQLDEQAVSVPKTKFVYEYPYNVIVTSQPMHRSH
jgi:TonB family protein